MNLLTSKSIAISLITLVIMGVFAVPTTTNAGWSDIFGTFSVSGNTNNSYGNSYDYNSTSANSDGDIELKKEVKEIGRHDDYHDKIKVRPGALVEVRLQVRNQNDDNSASTIVRDELGGSMVYVKNTLRVNGQTSQPGLTSGGLRLNIPANSTYTITYQMYVCGSSNYAIRAYASASIGAGTDAIIIETESYNSGYYYEDYSCYNQYQSSNTSGTTTGNAIAGNPFGDWTGVNNFSTTTTPATTTAAAPANNPFAGWTGVNNSSVTTSPNPFGDWHGVQNDPASNPFGTWTGVSSNSSYNGTSSTDAFGTWTGVQSSSSGNPFGDWTGVNSTDAQYDMGGYSTNTSGTANRSVAYQSSNTYADSSVVSQPQTNFVAPTTGVSKTAPFVFAGLLTAGFVAFRKRKLLFN